MVVDLPRPNFLRRAFRPTWTDLAPQILGENAPYPDHATASLWGLVLASRHVPHRIRQQRKADGGGWSVQVQSWFAVRAVEEIRLFMEENAPGALPVRLPDLRPVTGLEPTIFGMGLLLLFYWAYGRAYPAFGVYPWEWLELGSADAARILMGDWWRTFTAMTLHADGPHILGNCLIGGVFIWLVSRRLGAGPAWLLAILGGASGNLLNAVTLGVHHNAIGFSTASFAAAGVLAGITPFGVGGGIHGLGSGSLTKRFYRFLSSALVPVGAGLGLLAMLGAGDGTDLGGHLFGMVSGLILGVATGWAATRFGLPGKRADGWLYTIALALPVLAWSVAWLA